MWLAGEKGDTGRYPLDCFDTLICIVELRNVYWYYDDGWEDADCINGGTEQENCWPRLKLEISAWNNSVGSYVNHEKAIWLKRCASSAPPTCDDAPTGWGAENRICLKIFNACVSREGSGTLTPLGVTFHLDSLDGAIPDHVRFDWRIVFVWDGCARVTE
jgi:hypothetical protein